MATTKSEKKIASIRKEIAILVKMHTTLASQISELKELLEVENLIPKKTKEDVFLEIINGLTIDTETFKKSHPNSTFFIKDKKRFFELEKSELRCDYHNIWSVFESKFDMNYVQIQGFIKAMMEEHLNMMGVTPKLSLPTAGAGWKNILI